MRSRSSILLLLLACAVLLLSAGPAGAAYAPEQCVNCHTWVTPGIVTQFDRGAMGKAGLTCVDCHGGDHAAIEAAQGKVPASTCAQEGCHPQQYAEFALKDGSGNYVNKHAVGWTRMTAAARYAVMPPEQRYEMCERCHNVGYVFDDGSVGKCDSCHTRHTFSAAEAEEAEACGTCHMGPDHEQIDMWEKSKHGVVYKTEAARPDGDPSRAPSCITCHMPAGTDAGGNAAGEPLTHNVSLNTTYGTVAQGARLTGTALPVPMRTMTTADFSLRRGRMEVVCDRCHSPAFVTRNLEGADEIKRDVDDLLWDPVMRIRGLWWDGLLDPMPANRPPNPVFGPTLVLGGQQLYGGTSAIEQLFFYTYKYDHVNTFKGAYHINPDYSHWFGWSEVNQDRDLIKGEEAKLRKLSGLAPGFAATGKAVVGKTTGFDAGSLAAWGNASPNTYEWWWGDDTSTPAGSEPTVTHTYAAPGAYIVQLTCSDGDAVNDAANPSSCSGRRTTEIKIRAKYGAKLTLDDIKPVSAGARVSIAGRITTGDADQAKVQLWARSGSGAWARVGTRTVTTKAGQAAAVSFSRVLTKKTSYQLRFSGDADTWSAKSAVKTVAPR